MKYLNLSLEIRDTETNVVQPVRQWTLGPGKYDLTDEETAKLVITDLALLQRQLIVTS